MRCSEAWRRLFASVIKGYVLERHCYNHMKKPWNTRELNSMELFTENIDIFIKKKKSQKHKQLKTNLINTSLLCVWHEADSPDWSERRD